MDINGDQTPAALRKALASYASGREVAGLARAFFANLTYRFLDYFLSRELANHTRAHRRFASDANRVAFERALKQHTIEASLIVEEYAGGWSGKTVWQPPSTGRSPGSRTETRISASA